MGLLVICWWFVGDLLLGYFFFLLVGGYVILHLLCGSLISSSKICSQVLCLWFLILGYIQDLLVLLSMLLSIVCHCFVGVLVEVGLVDRC